MPAEEYLGISSDEMAAGVEHSRVRRNPDIIRPKPPIKPQNPLILGDLPETIPHAFVRHRPVRPLLLPLQPRLDKIKRQAEETRKEAGNRTRRQRLRVRRQLRLTLQLRLGLGEERQLPEIQRHRPHHRRRRPSPQRIHPLALGDPAQRIDHTPIIRPLVLGFQPIALHPYQRQIRRIPHHRRQPARCQPRRRPLLEPDPGAFALRPRLQRRHKRVEKPQPRRRIHGLPQQPRAQPRVQIPHLPARDNLPRHLQRRGSRSGLAAFARELQAHFYHVDGLDGGGGGHASEAAVDEGEEGAGVGVVEEGGGGGVFHGGFCVGGGGFGGVDGAGGG